MCRRAASIDHPEEIETRESVDGRRVHYRLLHQLFDGKRDEHRPRLRPDFVREAHRLHLEGQGLDDIASVLKLSRNAVAELLSEDCPL